MPSCCFGFDGNQLYCLPRAREAIRMNKLGKFCARFRSHIDKFTGLAKILIMRMTFRSPYIHSTLQRLKTKRQISKAQDVLKPSENHDYAQVRFTRTRRDINIAADFFRRDLQLEYVKHELHRRPFFVQTLNDIDEILNIKDEALCALPQKIEWITILSNTKFFQGDPENIVVTQNNKMMKLWKSPVTTNKMFTA